MYVQLRRTPVSRSSYMFGFLVTVSLFTMDFMLMVDATKCEPIKVQKCMGMPWTLTHMPNLVHHSSQRNAELVLSQFEPLLKMPASHSLLFFLCSMFTPMCFQHDGDFPRVVPPCRSICQDARNKVEPIMLKYNVSWPEALNCDYLPEYHRGMCIEPTAFIKTPDPRKCSAARPVKCKKCRRFKTKDKTFIEQDYDFVVRARVDKIIQKPCEAEARVNITDVYRARTLFLTTGVHTLTFNTSCACPRLKRNRMYVLAGHQHPRTGKLLLHPQSMAEKAGRKWEKKISKWIKKKPSKMPLNRRRRTNESDNPARRRGKRRRDSESK